MEAYLLTVKEALMDVVDVGISLKIVEGVRDLMLLDVVSSLKAATSESAIREELQEYLQVEHICSTGLDRIVFLLIFLGGADQGQEFFTAGGVEMLTTIMANHINSVDIQMNGCKLIHKFIQRNFYDHVRPLLESVVNAVVNAIRNYQDHAAVQVAAYQSFLPLMRMGTAEPSFVHLLAEAGGVPLLFSSLERYPTTQGVGSAAYFTIQFHSGTLPLRTYISEHPECHAIMMNYVAVNSRFLRS
jgi:hypothetical protein